MNLVRKLFELLDLIKPAEIAYAHCDIPCGIYDKFPSMMAARTVLTMVQKIKALPSEETLQSRNNFVRMVKVKEEHSEICKREILILWTDYFKHEHLEMFPDLHEKVWNACKLCSKNKQEINEDSASQLVEAVREVGEMWQQAEDQKKANKV